MRKGAVKVKWTHRRLSCRCRTGGSCTAHRSSGRHRATPSQHSPHQTGSSCRAGLYTSFHRAETKRLKQKMQMKQFKNSQNWNERMVPRLMHPAGQSPNSPEGSHPTSGNPPQWSGRSVQSTDILCICLKMKMYEKDCIILTCSPDW